MFALHPPCAVVKLRIARPLPVSRTLGAFWRCCGLWAVGRDAAARVGVENLAWIVHCGPNGNTVCPSQTAAAAAAAAQREVARSRLYRRASCRPTAAVAAGGGVERTLEHREEGVDTRELGAATGWTARRSTSTQEGQFPDRGTACGQSHFCCWHPMCDSASTSTASDALSSAARGQSCLW